MLAVMAAQLAHVEGFAFANGQPVFGDFIAFWSAGRAALDGLAAQVHDRDAIFAYQQLAAPGAIYVAPWNSPPTFLIVACALALLPYAASALLFLAASAALFFFAIRKLLPDGRALLLAATAPAVVYHAGTVQAGLLIGGISALALAWLERRPRAAGALIALLAIKPHLALLWPLYLALTRQWLAFAAAAATACAFALSAGLAFGFDAYVRFFANLAASQNLISLQQITTPAYASLYANLLDLGAAQGLALAAHVLSALAAIAFSCRVFLTGDRAAAGAALSAATMLISPYLFFYDHTLLMAGAALLGAPRTPLGWAAAIGAWGGGLSVALGYWLPLPVCPLAAWLVLAAALMRAGNAAPRPAPALHR